jgi:hypothetical protein
MDFSWKKKGTVTSWQEKAYHTVNLGLSCLYLWTVCGGCEPQILQLCQFIIPHTWKVDSSLEITFFSKPLSLSVRTSMSMAHSVPWCPLSVWSACTIWILYVCSFSWQCRIICTIEWRTGDVQISACYADKLDKPSGLYKRLLKASVCALGQYLSLETIPAIAWWTGFQVLVLHIPNGNVFTLE